MNHFKKKFLFVTLFLFSVITLIGMTTLSVQAESYPEGDSVPVPNGEVEDIAEGNLLLIGEYVFNIGSETYNLNNYIHAIQTAYFNDTTEKYEIYNLNVFCF